MDLLNSVADNIQGRTICALGDAAAMPVRAMIKHFRDEFEATLSPSYVPEGARQGLRGAENIIWLKSNSTARRSKSPKAAWSCMRPTRRAPTSRTSAITRNSRIAANCRMCLVDVEKAPKPMPACATPVTQGMIVRTKSDKAIKAQQSRDGVPADQPPAGLPDLRPGRRMPAAGPGRRLRRLRPRATRKKSASCSTRTSAR